MVAGGGGACLGCEALRPGHPAWLLSLKSRGKLVGSFRFPWSKLSICSLGKQRPGEVAESGAADLSPSESWASGTGREQGSGRKRMPQATGPAM